MKTLLLVCSTLILIGCATKEPVKYTAPSVVAVKTSLERLKPHVTTPAGTAAITDLSVAVDTYEAQVVKQSDDLFQAQTDAAFYRQKHAKAVRELWRWRGLAALTLASLAGWLALRMGIKFAI